jgi:4-hydroxyacetophenone monooxygenase
VEQIRQAATAVSEEELRAALEEANLPTLLVVLAHLTGDPAWVREPYVAGRPRGMDDNDSGGLPEELQARIRDQAVEVLARWRTGELADPGPLPEELLVELMTALAGEPVDQEFVGMIGEELGLVRRGGATPGPAHVPDDFDVLVIGAGLGGVCAGIKLGEAGIRYRVVEKNAEPGGTWSENAYPGAGVDTPSHLYSFSFEQMASWSRFYAKRGEINQYVAHCARRYGVDEHTSYETRATSARFEESSGRWLVELHHADGSVETVNPRVVISAVGQLNVPKVPDLPGMADFDGPLFHTARWPEGLDLRGKKVACVGTGASAMQLVPIVAQEAEELVVFQRSPQWAGPNVNYFREITDRQRLLFSTVPMYKEWYRFRLFWMFNDRVHRSLQIDPAWPHPERAVNSTNDKHRVFFTDHIVRELGERQDLLPDVLPDYPPFGKRMLIDNGWFAALTRPNVRLVTDGVAGFTASAVRTSAGEEVEADVVVLSTGFETLRLLDSVEVVGRRSSLREAWGDDNAFAYLGISVPDFPNFFCVFGPNTNLGHGGSIILNIECQVRYVVDLLTQMVEQGVDVVDCRPEVLEDYLDRVDAAHGRMIWSHPGFDSWYRNPQGRVVTNSPWRLVDYWAMTEHADLADYEVGRVGAPLSGGVSGRVSDQVSGPVPDPVP